MAEHLDTAGIAVPAPGIYLPFGYHACSVVGRFPVSVTSLQGQRA